MFKDVNGTISKLKDYTPNSALTVGLNISVTLGVLVKGSHFTFYINGKQIGEADDTTFTSGRVGLAGASGLPHTFAQDFSAAKCAFVAVNCVILLHFKL